MNFPLILFIVSLCSWDGILWNRTDHAIYISVVEIVCEQGANKASIKIKVFTDDMEDALTNEYGKRYKLTDPKGCQTDSKKIEAYFSQHLSIMDRNGKSSSLELDHCELLPDAVWFQFYGPCSESWEELKISANFLMELFPTQSNVISIDYNGARQFGNLTKANSSKIFKF